MEALRSVAKIQPFSAIPGPKSYPIVGTLHNYLWTKKYSFDRLHHNGLKKYREFGPLVREEINPGVNILWIFHPNDIRTMFASEGKMPARRSHLALEKHRLSKPDVYNNAGLLPTNGKEWARMRKSVQAMLSPKKTQDFHGAMQEISRDFAQMLRDSDCKGDLVDELKKYFLEVTGFFLFGKRIGAIHGDLCPTSAPARLMQAALDTNENILNTDNGVPLWRYFNTKDYMKIVTGQNYIEEYVRQEINAESPILSHCRGHEDLDEKDTTSIVSDLLLAGIDTSSYTTGFLFYHLARNLETQRKLRGNCLRNPPDLKHFSFGKQVLQESLRLNPISIGVGRLAPDDIVISGYHVPKGTFLVSQNQVSCRLPEFFDRPDDFWPERWDRSVRKKYSPYLVLPFGFGPRMCIARRLAEHSILVLVNTLFLDHEFTWKDDEKAAVDCVSKLINKPDKELLFEMKAVHRSKENQ